MAPSADLTRQILDLLPNIRAFARSLTRDPSAADDLVQETLLRALAAIDQFEAGSNLRAWLFCILRNCFYSTMRKRRLEVADVDGVAAGRQAIPPSQGARLEFEDVRRALFTLRPDLREAVILRGTEGLSYEEIGQICAITPRAARERVRRGRKLLVTLIESEQAA